MSTPTPGPDPESDAEPDATPPTEPDVEPSAGTGDAQSGTAAAPRRRHRARKALLGLAACLALLLVVVFGGGLYLQHRIGSDVHRIPNVFTGLKDRPTKPTTGTAAKAMNILLMGTDRRSDEPTTGDDAKAPEWIPGEQRTDTLMVLHIDGDRKGASVISIPRDSWVSIPGHGKAKINAAFSYAGPSLAVETVEQLTHVRIDHLAVVDWDGFKAITNALGGVDVTIPKTVYDSARHYTWTAGRHHLNGAQALLYVRERHGLPGGDFDRIHRQQNFLHALSAKVTQQNFVTHPTTLYHLLDLFAQHLSVDSGWSNGSMRSLAFSLRHLHASDVSYLTVPLAGTGREGAQDVVYLDTLNGDSLWKAVRNDKVSAWLAKHPSSKMPSSVR